MVPAAKFEHLRGVRGRKQPAFAFQAALQLGVGQRIEQAHHANRDRRRFNALDHRFSGALFLAVKADDEPGMHIHPGPVDLVYAVGQRAPRILFLLRRHEGLGIGAFDADEDRDEIRVAHQRQQRIVVGKIDRGLGPEFERIAPFLLPRDQVRKQLLHGLLVADEIIVDDVDVAAIADPVERIELGQDLFDRLDPRAPPVQLDDVAEFTGERAAAGKLHAVIQVLAAFE